MIHDSHYRPQCSYSIVAGANLVFPRSAYRSATAMTIRLNPYAAIDGAAHRAFAGETPSQHAVRALSGLEPEL
jgi:hypothetical protein